jgi:hypothetical protein
MRAPSGVECAHYYEDFHRGREIQECRVERSERSDRWRADDCAACPVPGILLRNDSPHLRLVLTSKTSRVPLLRRRPRIGVEAWCSRHAVPLEDAIRGCPECAAEAQDAMGRLP